MLPPQGRRCPHLELCVGTSRSRHRQWPGTGRARTSVPATDTYGSRLLLCGCSSKPGHVVDDRGEVRRSIELDLRQAGPIRLHDALDPWTERAALGVLRRNTTPSTPPVDVITHETVLQTARSTPRTPLSYKGEQVPQPYAHEMEFILVLVLTNVSFSVPKTINPFRPPCAARTSTPSPVSLPAQENCFPRANHSLSTGLWGHLALLLGTGL